MTSAPTNRTISSHGHKPIGLIPVRPQLGRPRLYPARRAAGECHGAQPHSAAAIHASQNRKLAARRKRLHPATPSRCVRCGDSSGQNRAIGA
jgi:hypothetical protein